MMLHALPRIDRASYVPHALHGNERAWGETNCYIDVWIEVLHSLKLNPLACMAMVFALDFDGDQWTFYKPPHEDLFTLYGIDVQELNVWRSLLENACTQLQRGRLVLTEADSLPVQVRGGLLERAAGLAAVAEEAGVLHHEHRHQFGVGVDPHVRGVRPAVPTRAGHRRAVGLRLARRAEA